MSLINDALKKAQRQRTTDAAGVAPPMPGESGGRITRRGKPMTSQAVLLLVAGGSVLIVLSVVATVYLLREPSPPAASPVPAATASRPAAAPVVNDSSAPAPVVFVPVLPQPEPVVESPPEPPAPVSTPPVRAEPAPAVIVSSPPPAPPVAASPDERIHDYLDRLHVLGVRSSGTDSRVLMNDRVYRLNDLVDRTLALRLVDVQPGLLIFEDARGVRYTKNL
jgi:hypothetical protein